MGTSILLTIYGLMILIGGWNILIELRLGLTQMLNQSHRNLFMVRFILAGVIPFGIGTLSLLIIFSNPFGLFPN